MEVWKQKEIDFAVKKRKEGWQIIDIAKKLKRSHRSVEKQMARQGVKLTPTPITEHEIIENEKRRLQSNAKDNLYKELLKKTAYTRMIIDKVEELVPKITLVNKPIEIKENKKDTEVMVLKMSDVHIGRVTETYNISVFNQRMDILAERILRLKQLWSTSRNINKIIILMEGDIIDGDAIFPGQPFEVAGHKMKQIFHWGVPKLSEFIQRLSENFAEVELYCVRGNHGRNTKFDSEEVNWDLVLYETLKLTTQNIKNVKWHITWDWYQIVPIFKWNFLIMHGHQIRTWLNIPFYGMIQKGMRWQGSIKGKWDYMSVGHFHTPLNFVWNNFEVIGNGTMVSDDDYPQRELGLSSEEVQIIFMVHPRKGVINYNKIFFRR